MPFGVCFGAVPAALYADAAGTGHLLCELSDHVGTLGLGADCRPTTNSMTRETNATPKKDVYKKKLCGEQLIFSDDQGLVTVRTKL